MAEFHLSTQVYKYDPIESAKQAEQEKLCCLNLPYRELISLTEDMILELPAYTVMWVRALRAATQEKPSIHFANWIQEHGYGKALQRTLVEIESDTFQKFIQERIAAERNYQNILGETNKPDEVVEVEVKELTIRDFM